MRDRPTSSVEPDRASEREVEAPKPTTSETCSSREIVSLRDGNAVTHVCNAVTKSCDRRPPHGFGATLSHLSLGRRIAELLGLRGNFVCGGRLNLLRGRRPFAKAYSRRADESPNLSAAARWAAKSV